MLTVDEKLFVDGSVVMLPECVCIVANVAVMVVRLFLGKKIWVGSKRFSNLLDGHESNTCHDGHYRK